MEGKKKLSGFHFLSFVHLIVWFLEKKCQSLEKAVTIHDKWCEGQERSPLINIRSRLPGLKSAFEAFLGQGCKGGSRVANRICAWFRLSIVLKSEFLSNTGNC